MPYNLLSYTEELTNGYWNKISVTVEAQPDIIDPKNGRGVFKVTDTSGGGTSYLHVPSIADANYGRSIYARTVSGTGTVSLLSYYGNTNNLFTLTEQWQRFYIDSVTTTTGQINFYAVDFRAGDLTEVLLYAPQMTKSPDLKPYLPTTDRANLPRLNYPVYGGCPSLLVEPQSTNLFPYSNDYTQSNWNKSNVTITQNAGISPENINNASKMIVSSTASFAYIYDTLSGSSSVYSISAFVKADGRNIVWLYINSTSTNGTIYYDLSDGTLQAVAGGSGTPTGTITAFPNDWYKITYTSPTAFVLNSGSGIGVSDAKGSTAATVDGTNGVLIYGLQIEAGSYATSYIPTSGSTVTRNEEQVQNSGVGTTDTFNSSEGVLYAEVENLAEDGNNKCISINDGSANNRVTIVLGTATNQFRPHVLSGGTAVFDQNTFTVPTSTQFNKIAVKYKANDFSAFVDGIKVASDNSGAAPIGLNNLSLHVGTGGLRYFGNVKAVGVYKTALTDTELANLTSYNNHDLFIPYRSRMQMINADQELQCTEHDITRFL